MGIEGSWVNEFGSTLWIGPVQDDGSFALTYQTAVSSGQCAQGSFVGNGYFSTSGSALGFSVLWRNDQSNCKSVTTWCGVYVVDSAEQIIAPWLLTSEDPENPWASTVVGQDTFYRQQQTQVAALRRGRSSHP